MLAWLEELQSHATTKHGTSAAYVHPFPITFTNNKQKDEWVGYQEAVKTRDTIQKFEKANHNKAKTWVALCDTPNQSYVGITLSDEEKARGVRQWDKVEWHSWGLAVVATASSPGKCAYIFDCDQQLPAAGAKFHAKDLTTQTQRHFISVAKDWNVKKLFIGNAGGENANRGKCLDATTKWIERMAQARGDAVDDEDERFQGFVEIGLNT